jgi:hypothetical protein
MKYIELKVNLPKDYAEKFTEFLDSLGVEGYYEILFDSSLPKPAGQILRDDTNIRVYLGELDLEKEIKINIFLKIDRLKQKIMRRLIKNFISRSKSEKIFGSFRFGKRKLTRSVKIKFSI